MKVLYVGSFNPFHNGHQYVYDLACQMFGKANVWIGIGQNSSKEKKTDQVFNNLARSLKPITSNVLAYTGLTADVIKKHGFNLLIRGIRPGQSVEQETELQFWNYKLTGVNTILIPTPPEVNFLSSGAIRELVSNQASVAEFMNPNVLSRWGYREGEYYIFACGKACCGKTTILKESGDDYVECDKELRNFLRLNKSKGTELKNNLKESFYSKDVSSFLYYIEQFALSIDWIGFFNQFGRTIYDFPNLGTYWEYIPESIRCEQSYIVEFTNTKENRNVFALKRGANPALVECNDFFYQSPPFVDKTIDLSITKEGFFIDPFQG